MQKNKKTILFLFAVGLFFTGVQSVPANGVVPIPQAFADESVGASAQTVKNSKAFVSSVTERGISFLSDPDLSQTRRKAKFEALLNDNFDMNTIGRFALGRYWRTASSAEKKEYIQLFRKMILNVYSNRFDEYKGQKIDVRGAKPEGKADVLVASFIVDDGSPEVQIDWRIRFKNNEYKIIDIIVEGVSMALTQRSDFSSVIQRGGGNLEVLLEHLRKQ